MNGSHVKDRRVGRTRNQLSSSLLGLLQTTPWKKITVQNIIDRADVGRSTFYSHFETKFDLLEAQLPILAVPEAAAKGTIPDFVPLFEHVRDEALTMERVLGQPVRAEIRERMHDRLAGSWTEILRLHHPTFDNASTTQFLAGATLAAMQHYLLDVAAATPQEKATELALLVTNTLRPV